VTRVGNGVELVNRTGTALQEIQSGVGKVVEIVGEISLASQEQSTGVDQVNIAVAALDDVTQQNAALVEEASAASRNAYELAEELVRQVSFFKIETAVGGAPNLAAMQTAPAVARGGVSSGRTPGSFQAAAA
jgi:methyl-accepting chemotaxis protein